MPRSRPPSPAVREAIRSAISRKPSGPWCTAYIDAITASSTCAVQMLLVAFSRRMCCSRVCRERRIRLRPVGVDRHAHQSTRQLPFESLTHCQVPGVRAAEAERNPEPLRRSGHDVRTQRAG